VAAVRQAAQQGWDRLTWQLAEVLWAYFKLRRYWDDWQETAKLGLLAARRAGDRAATGRLLHDLGYVLRDRRHPEAPALLRESLAVFRELGDRFWEGRVLGTLGTAYRMQRQLEEAAAMLEQSLAITREVGNQYGEGLTLAEVARASVGQRRIKEADTYLRQGLAIFRALGDYYAVGRVLRNFGLIVEHVRGAGRLGATGRRLSPPWRHSRSPRPPASSAGSTTRARRSHGGASSSSNAGHPPPTPPSPPTTEIDHRGCVPGPAALSSSASCRWSRRRSASSWTRVRARR
jgi:tetratricopeptide (TPR) repeat protein